MFCKRRRVKTQILTHVLLQEFHEESPFPVLQQKTYSSLSELPTWPPIETDLEEFLLHFTYVACFHNDPNAWEHAISGLFEGWEITHILEDIDFSGCHTVADKMQKLWCHFES
jgi:hypothetical protein